MSPQTIGYFCLIAGASMLAGWWTTFRNRPYVGLLGGFFVALAASLMIANRLETGPVSPALKLGWWVAVVLAGLLLLGAFVMAVKESRARLREVREHYRAASEALVAMARAQEELRRRQQAEPPTEDENPTETK